MALQQYVSFIPNAILESEVRALLNSASAAISPARKLTKNVIDPFGIVFEMSGFNLANLGNGK